MFAGGLVRIYNFCNQAGELERRIECADRKNPISFNEVLTRDAHPLPGIRKEVPTGTGSGVRFYR